MDVEEDYSFSYLMTKKKWQDFIFTLFLFISREDYFRT